MLVNEKQSVIGQNRRLIWNSVIPYSGAAEAGIPSLVGMAWSV
jgi:hypothetical protein